MVHATLRVIAAVVLGLILTQAAFAQQPEQPAAAQQPEQPPISPFKPEELEGRLRALGWDIGVFPTTGPFYWGTGGR